MQITITYVDGPCHGDIQKLRLGDTIMPRQEPRFSGRRVGAGMLAVYRIEPEDPDTGEYGAHFTGEFRRETKPTGNSDSDTALN